MTSRSLGHRAPLLWLVLPMLAGLVAARLGNFGSVGWALGGAAAAVLVAALASWRLPQAFRPALGIAMFLAGTASYALHRPRIAAWDHLPPREARLVLRIDRVFPVAEPDRSIGLATIVEAAEPVQELVGQRISYALRLRPDQAVPIRTTTVAALGVIESLPRDPPANTFDGYLANAGINFRFSRGRVLREIRPASAYRQFCAREAEHFARILGLGVNSKRPELVAVYRAMLLGRQQELSDEQRAQYRQSGTMHVFSISGLHIAAIAAGLYAVLILLRLPRPVQFLIGSTALWLYVEITGAAPSAVRAFVMVTLLQAALVLRVPRNPIAALTGSALLIAVFAPLQIFSASFQMSYGIVAALLLLGLPMADEAQIRLGWFRDLPKPTWRWHHRLRADCWTATLTAGAIGLAASLVSAVTGIMFFELFTPGALLANLWLIPAATLVILAGFVALGCGLLGFASGAVLVNHAAVLLLALIETGVSEFVRIPGGWWPASFRAPWIGGLTLVAVFGAMLLGYAQHWRGWQRGYWCPFAVVGLGLLLGVRFG